MRVLRSKVQNGNLGSVEISQLRGLLEIFFCHVVRKIIIVCTWKKKTRLETDESQGVYTMDQIMQKTNQDNSQLVVVSGSCLMRLDIL